MPVWAAWEKDPSAGTVARLKAEYEPQAAGAEAGGEDPDAWLDGVGSDDEECGSHVRSRRKQLAEREARAHWGSQPPATAQQLAMGLAAAVAMGRPRLGCQEDETAIAFKLQLVLAAPTNSACLQLHASSRLLVHTGAHCSAAPNPTCSCSCGGEEEPPAPGPAQQAGLPAG